MNRATKQAKKVGVSIVGGTVLVIGALAIPYPGPGWLIVFAGLAILATEFSWAQQLLDTARGKYNNWQAWLKRQILVIRIMFFGLTGIVVVTTIWLFNGYGLINNWLNLGLDWLQSPLPFLN